NLSRADGPPIATRYANIPLLGGGVLPISLPVLNKGVSFTNFAGEDHIINPFNSVERLVSQLGTGWMRIAVDWPSLQPDDPNHYKWASYDSAVLFATARGQSTLVDLAYTTGWAFSEPCKTLKKSDSRINCEHFAPGNLADWNAYVTAVVQRYTAPPFNV